MDEHRAHSEPSLARRLLPGLCLLVLALAAYWPALSAGFVWDDDANVTGNVLLRSPAGLWALWLDPGATTQYYPLVYTSFWIEHALWGLSPLGYHLDNIVLHAGCGILLWRLLVRIGLPGAWLAAAVFVLHPVHVESVAWVTERKNLLSGVFYLGSALVYLGHVSDAFERPDPRRRRAWWLLAFALFAAAILSKSPTATLPAALLLVIWWKKGRLRRTDVAPLVPWVLLSVPIALLTVSMEEYVGEFLGLTWAPSLVERFLMAGRAVWFYLGKLLWPTDLAFVYPRWVLDDRIAWQYLPPLLLALTLAALIRARHRIGRGPLTAALYFGGTLAPVLGFLEIYFFRFSLVADHWQYLASIGPITLVVCGSVWLATEHPRPARQAAGVALAGGLLILLGSLTWLQSHAYHSSEKLWRDSLAKNPGSPMAHYNLAHELELSGRDDQAREHYRWTIELAPTEARAYNNLGMLMLRHEQPTEALELLREAVRLSPDYARARWNLGLLLAHWDQLDAALPHLEHALRIPLEHEEERSKLIAAHIQLAGILMRSERTARARVHLREALAMDPRQVRALIKLGTIEMNAKHVRKAIQHFESALSIEPGNALAQTRLRRARVLEQGPRAPERDAVEASPVFTAPM